MWASLQCPTRNTMRDIGGVTAKACARSQAKALPIFMPNSSSGRTSRNEDGRRRKSSANYANCSKRHAAREHKKHKERRQDLCILCGLLRQIQSCFQLLFVPWFNVYSPERRRRARRTQSRCGGTHGLCA